MLSTHVPFTSSCSSFINVKLPVVMFIDPTCEIYAEYRLSFMSKNGMALSIYPATNIIMAFNSRKIIWVVHVVHVGNT
jgi:hypothetical protein